MPYFVKTDLASGMGEVKGMRYSSVGEVADAVIDALKFTRFDVYVPKSIGPSWALTNLLPRRAREALGRALNIDRALTQADHAARADYEARAAASAPAADAVIAETEKQESAAA
jgi:hypothetical protein